VVAVARAVRAVRAALAVVAVVAVTAVVSMAMPVARVLWATPVLRVALVQRLPMVMI
jgi:hypothetical protein